ncbi:MAG TPA: PilZ domain-containing protein [Myxococcota bacterium]|nr:PilZ domain-containing protein [Myxococcota bacterium]
MSDQGRRAPRFEVQLPVDIGVFETRLTCETTNVSRFGLHIDSHPGCKTGDLVWLRLQLPDTNIVEATMIARPAPEDTSGCGLSFSVFVHGSRRYWERFIASLEQGQRGEADERRTFPRAQVAVVCRIGGLDGECFDTHDLSAGGVYVTTHLPISDTSTVELVIVEPDSKTHLVVSGRVARRDSDGVAFEFVDVDAPTRRKLRAFVGGE